MNRISNVVRMQLVNRDTFIWVPLIVLGGALVVSLLIYAILRAGGLDTPLYGGGIQAPMWVLLAVGVQSLTRTFPFSQAMSVTRREFYLGTILTAAGTALGLAAVIVVGGMVEQATDGWGYDSYFFHLPWLWEAGSLGALVVFFSIAMLAFVLGFWVTTIFQRFGTIPLVAVLVVATVALLGAILLITMNEQWPAVFEWIMATGALGLALWGILISAILAVLSYFTLRRAVAAR